MAIGVRNSYATTQAPDDNILQSMQYVDQLDYRAKKDQALQDQAKAKKAEENLKEIDDYRNKFGVNLTGNQSVNDLVIPYASQARDKAADLTKRIQLSSNNQEKAQLMAERNRIVQSFDVLKQVPDVLNAKAKEIADGVEKGKYNERDVDAVQEVLGQLEKGQAHLYVDDNGQARITTFKTDESGNPTGIIEKEQTIVELINSATPYLKPTYDAKGGIAEQFTSQVKLDETEVQKGFTTITQKQLSDRVKEQAKKKGQEVATIDSEVYELWQRMGNEPKRKFSEEDRQKVAKYVEEDLLARYNTEFKKQIDQSGILAQQKFAYDKEKEEEDKPSWNIVEPSPEYARVGVVPAKGYKAVSITGNQKPIASVRGWKNGKQVTVSNPILNSFTVVKTKAGERRIAAEITYPDVKSSTLSPNEQKAFDIYSLNPEKATEEQKMIVQKINKGVENKTDVFYMTESEFVKFKDVVGAKNASDMANKAKVSEEDQYDEFGVKIN